MERQVVYAGEEAGGGAGPEGGAAVLRHRRDTLKLPPCNHINSRSVEETARNRHRSDFPIIFEKAKRFFVRKRSHYVIFIIYDTVIFFNRTFDTLQHQMKF